MGASTTASLCLIQGRDVVFHKAVVSGGLGLPTTEIQA
jgi:hypothetical protein